MDNLTTFSDYLRQPARRPWLVFVSVLILLGLLLGVSGANTAPLPGDVDAVGLVPHVVYELANIVIGVAYLAIGTLILSGLVQHGQVGRANPLGTATALIFFSCGAGHLAHVINVHVARIPLILITADVITAGVALGYWALRRNYGVLMGNVAQLFEVRRQLEATTHLNDAVLQAVDDGVILYDVDGCILQVNPRVEAITGAHDVVGINRAELARFPNRYFRYPILFEYDFDSVLERVMAGETLRDLRARIFTPTPRTISLTYSRVVGSDGAPLGMVATIHDVTSALAFEGLSIREERAEVERQRLLTVVDSLPEGVLIIDANERVVLANRAAQAIAPMPTGALLDDIDRPLDLYYPDGRRYPPAEQPLRRAMREKRPIESAEIILHRPSQRIIHLLVNAAPLMEPDGRVSGGVSVFQDIHHLREVERMKDEFLSIASHELRTPVTAIKGFAQLLARDYQRNGGSERARRSIDVINRQLDHLSELVNDLLDVSRIEAGRLELRRQAFDLDRLVTDVARALQVTSSQHVIDVSLSSTPVRIEGDAERVEQVISNLVTNAIKYSPEGGPIKIRCGRWGQTITPPPAAPAAIALDEGEWAVVSVEDHGIGIAPDHLVHIFDRFYRAMGDQHFGGLGLGLYISRELVEHHGGYIWAASQPGRGTRIAFALPLTPAPETTEVGQTPAPLNVPEPHETPAQP